MRPPGTPDGVLALLDLRRRYGPTVALDGLSLEVPHGAVVGFVGPNGAGKTTAMRIALGVLEPDAGEVLWRGRPADREARRRFGYMPEERGLYPKMTVERQLRYLARLHGVADPEADAAARALIERVGLAERAGDPVEELSLGNQQRVQIAAALVHDPDVLILDEPFSGLDPIGIDLMAEVLLERSRAGAGVVFSSHQLELVERICDQVAIVSAGRIVATGTVEELRADRTRGQRLRVEVEGAGDGWLDAIPGADVVWRDERGAVVQLSDGLDDQGLLDAARRAGRVRHFGFERPSLTELFREVVDR
jgi:ABC-2 type transport system ATP-binding protein